MKFKLFISIITLVNLFLFFDVSNKTDFTRTMFNNTRNEVAELKRKVERNLPRDFSHVSPDPKAQILHILDTHFGKVTVINSQREEMLKGTNYYFILGNTQYATLRQVKVTVKGSRLGEGEDDEKITSILIDGDIQPGKLKNFSFFLEGRGHDFLEMKIEASNVYPGIFKPIAH